MGTKSLARGSVQSIIPIPNHGAICPDHGALPHAVRALDPGQGIDPDIMVEQAKIEQVADTSRHESDLPGAIENKGGTDVEGRDDAPILDPDSEQTSRTDARTGSGAGLRRPEAGRRQAGEPTEPFVGSERDQIARPDLDYQLACIGPVAGPEPAPVQDRELTAKDNTAGRGRR